MTLAAVTVAELLVGVRLASAKRRKGRRANVDGIIESFPIIAATARATGRAVVAADQTAHIELPGVTIGHR